MCRNSVWIEMLFVLAALCFLKRNVCAAECLCGSGEGNARVETDCRLVMWRIVSECGDNLGTHLEPDIEIEKVARQDIKNGLPTSVLQKYKTARFYTTFWKTNNLRMEEKVYWTMHEQLHRLETAIRTWNVTRGGLDATAITEPDT
ncbi:hypothetical protein OSTOST_18760, partial [Ostertagia ostertagi]